MSSIHTLVIACGNPLRGDDAVGPAAADIIASWQTPGVKVLAVHQLAPELIEEMKLVEGMLFIDAATNIEDCAFQARIVAPTKSRRHFGHHETPANLLALLHDLEARAPQAWLVTIAADSFDHGEAITAGAEKNLHKALAWIRTFLITLPGMVQSEPAALVV